MLWHLITSCAGGCMTLRWHFLTEEEKDVFDQYDIEMVKLLGKRMKAGSEETVEKQIKELHQSIDLFVMDLQEKYSSEKKCDCYEPLMLKSF